MQQLTPDIAGIPGLPMSSECKLPVEVIALVEYFASLQPVAGTRYLQGTVTSGTSTSLAYVEITNIRSKRAQQLRVSYRLYSNGPSYPAYAMIYKNGVAITAVDYAYNTPLTFTHDVDLVDGDTLQIFAAHSVAGNLCTIDQIKYGTAALDAHFESITLGVR